MESSKLKADHRTGKAISKDKCLDCSNLATKTTPGKGHFLLWGCRKLKFTFGLTSDFRSGKNTPKNCKEYEKKEV